MNKKERITAVKAGEIAVIDGESYPVGQPCDNKHDGHWYCLTHREGFGNQFQKDTHTHANAPCHFVWICHQHGPEQP